MIRPLDILHGRILIVDDQEANILLLEQMLRGAGYDSITSTQAPDQVCELHLLNHYDLILLDLQMPGMDGFQVMENLKEIERGSYLPVLVITAQPNHKLRALKAGARDFVSKPFDLAEVLVRVHNLLEVRLLHQESKQLCEQVMAEQKIAERLLLKVLPPSIAERLRERPKPVDHDSGDLISESYAEVTLLFTDIVDFTKFCEGTSATVLRGVLEDISTRFDSLAGATGSDRTRVLGDAYLAAVGLSGHVADRSILASRMALDLIDALDRYNDHCRYKLKLSIGTEAFPASASHARKRALLQEL